MYVELPSSDSSESNPELMIAPVIIVTNSIGKFIPELMALDTIDVLACQAENRSPVVAGAPARPFGARPPGVVVLLTPKIEVLAGLGTGAAYPLRL